MHKMTPGEINAVKARAKYRPGARLQAIPTVSDEASARMALDCPTEDDIAEMAAVQAAILKLKQAEMRAAYQYHAPISHDRMNGR